MATAQLQVAEKKRAWHWHWHGFPPGTRSGQAIGEDREGRWGEVRDVDTRTRPAKHGLEQQHEREQITRRSAG
jgi:hypothetical protein